MVQRRGHHVPRSPIGASCTSTTRVIEASLSRPSSRNGWPARFLAQTCGLLLLLGTWCSLVAAETSPDLDAVRRHAEALLACGDASVGGPGAARRAAYLKEQLRATGFESVHVRRSTVTAGVCLDGAGQVAEDALHIEILGQRLRIASHAPNFNTPASTYDRPLTGILTWLGGGEIPGPADLGGRIAVLRADSGHAWLECAERGAAAVLFVQPELLDSEQLSQQCLPAASLDMPRFVLAEAWDPTWAEQSATISAPVALKPVTVETLVAELRGTKHAAGSPSLLISAGYDGSGLVRGLDPAAHRAWNSALLLALASELRARPPERDVIIVFHAGRVENFRGLNELLASLGDASNTQGSPDLMKRVQWPEAPLGDAEAVETSNQLWEVGLLAKDFAAYLALPEEQRTENALRKLMTELDTLPETSGAYDGLAYPPGVVAAATGAAPAGGLGWAAWLSAAVLAGLALGLLALRLRRRRPTWAVATCCWIVLGLFTWQVLTPAKVFTTTDTIQAGKDLATLGMKFLAEEAARRADVLGPALERLRLLDSLLTSWDVEALAGRATSKDRQRRWTRDQLTMREAFEHLRRLLPKAQADLLPTMLDTEHADQPTRETIHALALATKQRHQGWRNLQQKLDKARLEPHEFADLTTLVAAVLGEDGRRGLLTQQRAHLERIRADLLSGIALRGALRSPKVGLAIELDLSDGGDRFGSISSGLLTEGLKDGEMHTALARVVQQCTSRVGAAPLAWTDAAYIPLYEPYAWWPRHMPHAAAAVGLHQPTLTLATVLDRRFRHGTPTDDAARFDSDRFLSQAAGLGGLVREIAVSRAVVERGFPNKPVLRAVEAKIETRSEGSVDGRKGYPFPCLVQHQGETINIGTGGDKEYRPLAGDVQQIHRHWGDAFGMVRMLWVPGKGNAVKRKFTVAACGYDPAGRLREVVVSDGIQKGKAVDNSTLDTERIRDLVLQVFTAEASAAYGIMDPRLLRHLSKITPLSAARDAKPDYAHHERDGGIAVLFSPPGVRIRLLASEGEVGNRLVLLGDHLGADQFRGLVPGGSLGTEPLVTGPVNETIIDAAPRARSSLAHAVARDLAQLNQARLEKLQRTGISPEAQWKQQAQGQRHLDEADRLHAAGDAASAESQAQAAWAYLAGVYPKVVGTANDVVYGLVVMLLLAIPFALILERLLLAGATIVRKVLGFSGMFVLVFLFFFFFHPAFSLATTPVIIFLAFAIILLSSLVIALIYSRFEHEMRLIRLTGLGTHTADVNRLSTLFATGQLGISNMRRRPLRTVLTATTVVLMTFILLTFANFRAGAELSRLSLGVPPVLHGTDAAIQLSIPGWSAYNREAEERIRQSWGDELRIHARRWLQSDDKAPWFPIPGPLGPGRVDGVVGSSPGDPCGLDTALVRGSLDDPAAPRGWDPEAPEGWLFLPPSMLAASGLVPGSETRLLGLPLRVGSLDTTRIGGMSGLGGDPITPLSLAGMSAEQKEELSRQQKAASSGETVAPSGSFSHLGPEQCAVAHERIVARLGGGITSFTLVPWTTAERPDLPAQDLDAIAADMAHQLATGVVLGARGDCVLVRSVAGVSLSGFSDVLIPLILGGLIIFSTMLGSVAERGKEIFIFASLGLAPIHVGALFLVEAGIYAVLGGLGGYMLAQLLVAALGMAASMGWGIQPDLNYSSFTAVATILLVMATVLISALYPAWVAARSARPGQDADFQVPAAVDDRLEIPFPFTVAARDIAGLLAFLRAYLDANTEASVGCFTAAEAKLESRPEENLYAVSARTWLAPFDLGISQDFRMTAKPTDVPAISSVHISLHLLSGQRNAWARVVLPFLKELRKQFLVWRTLDALTMDRYRAAGGDAAAAARLAAATVPTPAAAAVAGATP